MAEPALDTMSVQSWAGLASLPACASWARVYTPRSPRVLPEPYLRLHGELRLRRSCGRPSQSWLCTGLGTDPSPGPSEPFQPWRP